ncbi:MAG: acyloxyacyl hydrolase [Acidobacteriaceae bacterium]|nr:acyloxyacyl hydrolase [Acidobacteriaceae bacterium]
MYLLRIRSIASRARAGRRQSFGVFSSFAPNSSHILIGDAEKRRVWTAGLEYSHRLWGNDSLRLDYEGSVSPFFQERDPTVVATYPTVSTVGLISYVEALPSIGERVVYATNNPVGYVGLGDGSIVYVYAVYGSTKTYALAISPLGARVSGFSSHRLQPTFSADLGMVFSSRDLPVDGTASSNFLFSFGPGMQLIQGSSAIRLEYLYRHMSNANSGDYNPGVDSGVFRLTLSRLRTR